jgi:hypothetical protein
LFAILSFFGVLAGLATLLERIVRANFGAIGAALRGPRQARPKPSLPARTTMIAR